MARALIRSALTCRDLIDTALHPDRCAYDADTVSMLEELWVQCGQFRWAHPLSLRKTATVRVDRTRSLLAGPLFTSDKHPWPADGERLMEPIAQIDLSEAGRVGGVNIGRGMLQFWMNGIDGFLRTIPMTDVNRSELTPPPDPATSNVRDEFIDPMEADLSPAWLERCFTITGTRSPVLSLPPMLKTVLDEVLAAELRPRLRASLEKLDRLVSATAIETAPHLFGNFDSIQYDVIDKPPTLLALESDGNFMWGDGGNAQIFYSIAPDGAASFETDYSCQ